MTRVSSLLLPMQQKPLLVPSVCVVEVVAYSRPKQASRKPGQLEDWYLGEISWRNLGIPLISFECMNQRRFVPGSAAARIAILNNTSGHSKTPFYGMVIQGMPKLMELEQDEVDKVESPSEYIEQMSVSVRRINSCIPNLSLVEQMIAEQVSLNHPTDTASA